MKVMIHRAGQDYGPYTMDQIRDLIAKGEVTEDDLAWPENGVDWVPLKSILTAAPVFAPIRAPIGSAPPPPGTIAPAPAASRLVMGCVVATGLLVVLAVLVLVFAPLSLSGMLGSLITAGPSMSMGPVTISPIASSNYSYATSSENGDVLTVEMKTDYTGEKLRDKVLEQIYSMATDGKAKQLQFNLHETASGSQKDVVLTEPDMDAVRAFADKKAYAASDARADIDRQLTAAGL